MCRDQKEDCVRAHILVCFLAFVLCKLLGQLCRKAGPGDESRRVLAELSELPAVEVLLPTKVSREIRTRCVTRPSARVAQVTYVNQRGS